MGTVATITEPPGNDKPLLSDKVMTVYGPYLWAHIITDTKCMYCCTVVVREKVTAGWTNCMGSRDSSVGIVSQLWFGQSGFRFLSDARDFSSLKRPDRLAPPPPRNYYHRIGIDRTLRFMTSSLVSTLRLMLVRFTVHLMSVL